MTGPHRAGTLWLTPGPRPVTGGDVAIVLDAAWTPDPAAGTEGREVSVRDAMDEVLRRFDPIAEASALLDAWAARSGVIPALTIGRTSFWYYVRLRHWTWLQERVLWAQVLRRLLADHDPAVVACAEGIDPALLDVAALMTAADGLELRLAGSTPSDPGSSPGDGVEADEPAGTPTGPRSWAATDPGQRSPASRSLVGRALGRLRRELGVGGMRPARPTMAMVEDRLSRLAAEDAPRLLVVLNHLPQRIETPDGQRLMNPYLGPVADRLRGTRLEPILLDFRMRLSSPEAAARLMGPGAERTLPWDVIRVGDEPPDPEVAVRAAATARSLAKIGEPITTAGIDLGPSLAREVAAAAAAWFPSKHVTVARFGRLLARLHPAGVLVADEYHRQDWMEAAAAAGIPVAAIQHGIIHRQHEGYIHPDRPSGLHLPDRTYVFGTWERDLLIRQSMYRDDEVAVGGSARLDLYRPATTSREEARAACGVAAGDRMVVLSGTWGRVARRFHYPVVLARLFDRPQPGIHLVVKLHPGEPDEGPYRAVVEGVAAARGFAPPPITVVRDVDLYRLLAAADAHLGILSTVLTEAVFVGTPNLLAVGIEGGDLLDYLESGVALPVTGGGDLPAALDAAAAGAITTEARAAFLARHFEPGPASVRIAQDLLRWLSPQPPAVEES